MLDLKGLFRAKAPPQRQESGLFIYRSLGPARIVIVTLFDVERTAHDDIIAKVGKTFAKADKIVYVTDYPDFLHFRDAGAAFEYLPSTPEQQRHASDLAWRDYLTARWDLILAKWQPEHVLAYGTRIDHFLASAPGREET